MGNEYKIKFYVNIQNHKMPAREFILSLPEPLQDKINKYFNFLKLNNGYLDEPYSRHIIGKIRELRVDFRNIRHRLFYFAFVGKTIVILHGFVKKTSKTPPDEISIAVQRLNDVINNPNLYE